MYGKIHTQIFDSSIMDEGLETRYVWLCLIALADKEGFLDMTPEAIARRSNIPEKAVKEAIERLAQPDPRSRSKVDDGRRLVPIRESFGWQIVNFSYYRDLKSQDERREYMREYMQEYRKRAVNNCKSDVNSCKQELTQLVNTDTDTNTNKTSERPEKSPSATHKKELSKSKSLTHRLVGLFVDAYQQHTGQVYALSLGRDGKIMKELGAVLANGGGMEEAKIERHVEETISRFFDESHKFKGNMDIPQFKRSFNRLQASGQDLGSARF